jgi:hypothetical protein
METQAAVHAGHVSSARPSRGRPQTDRSAPNPRAERAPRDSIPIAAGWRFRSMSFILSAWFREGCRPRRGSALRIKPSSFADLRINGKIQGFPV